MKWKFRASESEIPIGEKNHWFFNALYYDDLKNLYLNFLGTL